MLWGNNYQCCRFLKLMRQVVNGVGYIHEHGFIHRDIACRNILVTHVRNNLTSVKISDFGLAYNIGDQVQVSLRSAFSWPWHPPECYIDSLFSKGADVWALGVTMWEILLRGRSPYRHLVEKKISPGEIMRRVQVGEFRLSTCLKQTHSCPFVSKTRKSFTPEMAKPLISEIYAKPLISEIYAKPLISEIAMRSISEIAKPSISEIAKPSISEIAKTSSSSVFESSSLWENEWAGSWGLVVGLIDCCMTLDRAKRLGCSGLGGLGDLLRCMETDYITHRIRIKIRCLGLDSFWILGKLLDRQVKKTWGSSANNLPSALLAGAVMFAFPTVSTTSPLTHRNLTNSKKSTTQTSNKKTRTTHQQPQTHAKAHAQTHASQRTTKHQHNPRVHSPQRDTRDTHPRRHTRHTYSRQHTGQAYPRQQTRRTDPRQHSTRHEQTQQQAEQQSSLKDNISSSKGSLGFVDIVECQSGFVDLIEALSAQATRCVPNRSMRSIKTSRTIPTTSRPVPISSTSILTTSIPATSTSTSVPSTSASILNTSASIASTSALIPSTTSASIPSTTSASIPSTSASIPSTSASIPNTSTSIPSASTSTYIPMKLSSVPKLSTPETPGIQVQLLIPDETPAIIEKVRSAYLGLIREQSGQERVEAVLNNPSACYPLHGVENDIPMLQKLRRQVKPKALAAWRLHLSGKLLEDVKPALRLLLSITLSAMFCAGCPIGVDAMVPDLPNLIKPTEFRTRNACTQRSSEIFEASLRNLHHSIHSDIRREENTDVHPRVHTDEHGAYRTSNRTPGDKYRHPDRHQDPNRRGNQDRYPHRREYLDLYRQEEPDLARRENPDLARREHPDLYQHSNRYQHRGDSHRNRLEYRKDRKDRKDRGEDRHRLEDRKNPHRLENRRDRHEDQENRHRHEDRGVRHRHEDREDRRGHEDRKDRNRQQNREDRRRQENREDRHRREDREDRHRRENREDRNDPYAKFAKSFEALQLHLMIEDETSKKLQVI
ncbi:hypothetical protein AAMO2058_001275400 [Amorphochlora amoebiformis]